MNTTAPYESITIDYEYAKNIDGRIVSIAERNPVITIKYTDGSSLIVDTNLMYRNGWESGFKAGKQSILDKIDKLFDRVDED